VNREYFVVEASHDVATNSTSLWFQKKFVELPASLNISKKKKLGEYKFVLNFSARSIYLFSGCATAVCGHKISCDFKLPSKFLSCAPQNAGEFIFVEKHFHTLSIARYSNKCVENGLTSIWKIIVQFYGLKYQANRMPFICRFLLYLLYSLHVQQYEVYPNRNSIISIDDPLISPLPLYIKKRWRRKHN